MDNKQQTIWTRISGLFGGRPPVQDVALPLPVMPEGRFMVVSPSNGGQSGAGKRVTPDTARQLSTAYRCGNIISDDIASMPFQMFRKVGRNIQQVAPDAVLRNLPYLLEVQPNRWMTPFIFKKTIIMWLLYWGDAYIWQPPGAYRELFVLPSSSTYPVFDADGTLWYETWFPSGSREVIPGVEMAHLMINSADGFKGRSVLTFARETMGRQLGAHETQAKFFAQGLNPAALIYYGSELNKEAREKVRASYEEAMSGSEHAYRLAILDNKVTKFEPVTMKPVDAQFLESVEATDAEIANFFGLPLYKLNMGKQSYESNEQQNLDYLRTTLNPYLVQFEQCARLSWLRTAEQGNTYFRFIRESLLQTDAKSQAEYLEKMIFSGQLTPNEARQIKDMSAYPGGDDYYIPANMVKVISGGEETDEQKPDANL